ncbi:MAG: ParB/RepB/Spo0J family partition protein [Bacteroidetes bacterium]|nr:MAG: ParB/RepB/Spo0J family partition protein [Bacteroidota bacterium]
MSIKKAALGRGLNALLPSQQAPVEPTEEAPSTDLPKSRLYHFEDRIRLLGRVADIEVEHIRPNPYQPRRDFDEAALDELAASITQLGIIQPITVRGMENGRFEVISGERRLRAARRAGLKRIPAYVRDADSEAMLEMALVENVQREELNPIEVALGYQRLIEECGLTQEQVAQKVGKNRTTVANALRLLRLPPRIQASLRDGSLSAGHARALLGLDSEEEQLEVLQEIEQRGLSVRDVEELVRKRQQPATPPPAEPPTPQADEAIPERDRLQLDAYTAQLRARFSTKVQIKHKPGSGGRIEIAYYSDEDLERIMDLLNGGG